MANYEDVGFNLQKAKQEFSINHFARAIDFSNRVLKNEQTNSEAFLIKGKSLLLTNQLVLGCSNLESAVKYGNKQAGEIVKHFCTSDLRSNELESLDFCLSIKLCERE